MISSIKMLGLKPRVRARGLFVSCRDERRAPTKDTYRVTVRQDHKAKATATPATTAIKGPRNSDEGLKKVVEKALRGDHLGLSLLGKVRLSYDAISQWCWINQAAARQIDNTGRDDLTTLLVACVDLLGGAGLLEGFGHSFNCRGTKGCLGG
jgi:hypothetical protein